MKIALIGYGKMGKTIEQIALQRGHEIIAIFDSKNNFNLEHSKNIDVAIEFTQPHLAVKHIFTCMDAKIPLVTGTTGWYDELDLVKSFVQKSNGSFLFASNFSIGVNLFFALNQKLAQLMSIHPEYQVSIEEIHHLQKLDAPSGTAISIANGILKNNSNLKIHIL